MSSRINYFAHSLVPAILLSLLGTATARADDCVIPREQHPWGSFRPGSWKLVKVTTQAFDESGKVTSTSITETRTKLLAADVIDYEVQVDVTIEVGGKRFASEPKISAQGYQGEGSGQKVAVRRLAGEVLKVAGRSLTTQLAELEVSDEDARRVSRVHLQPGGSPLVVARHATLYDAAGKVLQETELETTGLQVPRTLLGFRYFTWQTKTTQKFPTGSVITEETHSAEVPGGVVEHNSEERDSKGNVVRRSKLELVNYGVAKTDAPPIRRRIPRKSRR